MKDVVDRSKAEPWQAGRNCAMCLVEDPAQRYYKDPWNAETWYCETCWERSELQRKMVDLGLEQNPEVEN